MGAGPILYFRFLFFMGFVVLLIGLTYSIPNLVINLQRCSLLTEECTWGSWQSMGNLHTSYTFASLPICLLFPCTILLSLIFPIFMHYILKSTLTNSEPQNCFHHLQAFSVLFKMQKSSNYSEDQIVKSINQWYYSNSTNHKYVDRAEYNIVQNVYFHFNMDQYEIIKKEIQSIEKQRLRHLQQKQKQQSEQLSNSEAGGNKKLIQKQEQSQNLRLSHQEIMDKLNILANLKEKVRRKQLEKTNKFIIVFKKVEHANLFKNQKSSWGNRKYLDGFSLTGNNKISVFQAPFPYEIAYPRQHYSIDIKFKKRIISWLINLIIIAIGAVFQLLCFYTYSQNIVSSSILSYLPILFAFIFCVIADIASRLSIQNVEMELQPCLSHQNSSANIHIIVTQISLKCIFVVLIHKIMVNSQSKMGIVEIGTWILIITSITMILSSFFNFKCISSCLKNKFMNRLTEVTQKQMNIKNEKFQGQFHLKYSKIISLFGISALYSGIIPISFLIMSIPIFFYSLTQLLSFVYVCKQPSATNEHLFIKMISFSWKLLIFLSLSQVYLIFQYEQGILQQISTKILIIVLLSIGTIVLFVPIALFCPQVSSELTYKQIKNQIISNYDDFNPLYLIPEIIQKPLSTKKTVKDYSQILTQQLNMLSRSLQMTLRQKIFDNNKSSLKNIIQREEPEQLYFQYDTKVAMPSKANKNKKIVPPIFKQNQQDVRFRRKSQEKKKKQSDLVRLTDLVTFEQQQNEGSQMKKKIKQSILGQINKIQSE